MSHSDRRRLVAQARDIVVGATAGYRLPNLTRQVVAMLTEIENSIGPDMLRDVADPAMTRDDLVALAEANCPKCYWCGRAAVARGTRPANEYGAAFIVHVCKDDIERAVDTEPIDFREFVKTLRSLGHV